MIDHPPTDAEMAGWMVLCEQAAALNTFARVALLKAAREALPRLIAEVTGLIEERDGLRVEIDRLDKWLGAAQAERDGLRDRITKHESAMKVIGETAQLLEKDKGLIASLAALRTERDVARADWQQCAAALTKFKDAYSVYVPVAVSIKTREDIASALAIAERHANKEGGDRDDTGRIDNAPPAPNALGERAIFNPSADHPQGLPFADVRAMAGEMTIEIDAATLGAAQAVINRMDARKGENVEEWANKLSADLVAAGEE